MRICTPNRSHAEIAVAALEAGKHNVRKPMAKTVADADDGGRARKSGKKLTIAYQNRFRKDGLLLKIY